LRLIRWWHLLSFDAPTVAVVWAYLFARMMHVRLPWLGGLILGLGTWLIYIADRLLDGVCDDELKPLRERHHFYARNCKYFLLAALTGCTVLLWLIATHMSSFTRRNDTVVFGVVMVYFAAIHRPCVRKGKTVNRSGHNEADSFQNPLLCSKFRLPKEVAVAILFAVATAVPVWSRIGSNVAGQYIEMTLAVLCFATLCWLNCVAIEHWETTNGFEPSFKHMHATTKWAGRNLARIALAVCLIALDIAAATTMLPKPFSLQSVFLSAALSAIVLFALDRFRRKLSSMQLRVAADAALLTPLIFLFR